MKFVINNGFLIDPKNNISSKMNIAFENGKVTEISKDLLKGDKVIDATNLVVTPGFIDAHMHEDPMVDDSIKINIFEKMLRMGVTTAIGGNCGIGEKNISKYLDYIDKGFLINYGSFLPHEILRKYVDCNDRYANIENSKLEKMYIYGKKLMKENGLLGVSFGLEYIPGIDFNELITISKIGENKIVCAHLRKDAENSIDALEEFLEIGKFVKTHLQVSHIGSMAGYGQMKSFLQKIEDVKKLGLDISCDCYPYTAFSTYIGSAVFDNDYIEKHNVNYNCIEILEGEYKGQRCTKELFNKLRKDTPQILVAGHMMLDYDIDLALKYSDTIVISDGILGKNGDGHPRATGTFPRFLAKYVRDKKLMSLEDGIKKITYQPAKILGINKGSLEVGADADITIFSLEELKDRATFYNSNLSSEGIKYVFINGALVLDNGKIINSSSGKSIRKY